MEIPKDVIDCAISAAKDRKETIYIIASGEEYNVVNEWSRKRQKVYGDLLCEVSQTGEIKLVG
jgi:hypothetical protein